MENRYSAKVADEMPHEDQVVSEAELTEKVLKALLQDQEPLVKNDSRLPHEQVKLPKASVNQAVGERLPAMCGQSLKLPTCLAVLLLVVVP